MFLITINIWFDLILQVVTFLAQPDETNVVTQCNECQNIVQEDDENAFGCDGLHCIKWYHRMCLDTDHQTHADLSVIGGKFYLS